MMRVATLVLLSILSVGVAICSTSSSSEYNVHITSSLSSSETEALLTQGHDMRGSYGLYPGFVVVVNPAASFPFSLEFVHRVESNQRVVVIEGANKNSDFSATIMKACPSHVTALSCLGDACVIVHDSTPAAEAAFHACLPYDAELVALPLAPVARPAVFSVSDSDDDLPKVNSVIEELVKAVDSNQIHVHLDTLTSFHTRHSQSTGNNAPAAAIFIHKVFSENGLTASFQNFRSGYSDNVIGDLPGSTDPSKVVIIGAHYDCRMSTLNSNSSRAPGANDDGSGTAVLMEMARVLGKAKIRIPYTIRLVAFSGEEQGLYGSDFYAKLMKSQGVDVVAMIQADMVGYVRPNNQPSLALASRATTAALNNQLARIINQYLPSLPLGTDSGCCSDQQSFFNQGYAAALFVEQGGATVDPQYHQSGDLINRTGFSIQLIYLTTQAAIASALTLANLQ
eukprot:TRINITY_DN4695_c0_g1_i1.p1 TRINITY_DN4695_c0_g1~~TRINITY_DN4695_c0_g1_i1.p1  ORF type:complete len:453 (-),score=105.24 TRINITY_DN4695_c0_g1_i1:113-1471(-)